MRKSLEWLSAMKAKRNSVTGEPVSSNVCRPSCPESWGHYATNRKVAGSILDEVNFQIYAILPDVLGLEVYLASNRNEYQKQKNNNVVSGE
jgi:hypothetical protein